MLLWSGRLWGFNDCCAELHGLLPASELRAPSLNATTPPTCLVPRPYDIRQWARNLRRFGRAPMHRHMRVVSKVQCHTEAQGHNSSKDVPPCDAVPVGFPPPSLGGRAVN